MAVASQDLERRVGGSLETGLVCRLFEKMQHAPVLPIYAKLEQTNLAMEALDSTDQDEAIWACMRSWFEVRSIHS